MRKGLHFIILIVMCAGMSVALLGLTALFVTKSNTTYQELQQKYAE